MDSLRDHLTGIRDVLLAQIRSDKATHAGLWLDKYIAYQESKEKELSIRSEGDKKTSTSRSKLVEEVSELPIPEAYKTFFDRWKQILTSHKALTREASVKGRMVIGMGDESVLETSITLHRTYGVPYIPGSALKGLAASYARQRLGDEWKPGSQDHKAYKVIFGDTDEAGLITFFDALYIPPETRRQVLYPDVITVHHQDYYQDGTQAPADWDNPNPVPFLSATGSYLIALAAPEIEKGSQRDAWINTTFDILEHALKEMGIGAKTSSGYGRMEIKPPPVDPEVKKAEGYIKEINSLPNSQVANQIQGYYPKWQQFKSDEGRVNVARAIVDKVRQAGREKASADKAWYKELLVCLGETNGRK